MTKQQKIIIIIFAVLDLLIIGGIVYVVMSGNNNQVNPYAPLTVCETALTEALQPQFSVRFNYSEGYPERLTIHLSVQEKTLTDSELLWTILDFIAPVVRHECQDTSQVIVQLQATQGYVFVVDTTDLTAWIIGTIDDDTLSNRIRYRMSFIATPVSSD